MLLICSQQIIHVETKSHCNINSHSYFPASCLFDIQVAAKKDPTTGIDAEAYSLHAGHICIGIHVFFFSCLYYQNSVPGSLVIQLCKKKVLLRCTQ